MAERRSGGKSAGTARKSSGSAKSRAGSASRSSGATKRSAAAKKGGQARGRQQGAKKRAAQTAGAATKPAELSGKSVADVRNALTRGIIGPLNLVMLTRDRIEEVMDEAVSRGRMTADDAQKLAQDLINRGRKQTNDVLGDLETLLGRAGATTRRTDAASRARRQVSEATARARSAAEPVLARADRARRAAGVGPTFPIMGYDDLTVSQVQSRLANLKPPELRKVRDYEKRHANRKTVLADIEQRLGS
jgi:polyhydroxyalkanoate synthesis regulator phasin